MSKIKQYKGFIIADTKGKESYKYHVYFKDVWVLGNGYRYPEWEADNMQECIDFIDSY
jgi:hypothetical protein